MTQPTDTIYLDHAATSPLRPEVLSEMMPYLREEYGNPSSVHGSGRRARHAVELSRERVATALGVEPGHVIFTSGGTEANNTAILGGRKGKGLLTSVLEHDAVLSPSVWLESQGVSVVRAGASPEGTVEPFIPGSETGLVSLIHVNNEVGSVNSICRIAQEVRAQEIAFHTDAVQSSGFADLEELAACVDYMTLSGHKMGGPKGVGILLAREPVESLLRGGPQERDRRAGTENVAAIVGFASALELAQRERSDRTAALTPLRDKMVQGLTDELGDRVRINTPLANASPHILNVSFLQEGEGLDGEMLILGLDMAGVEVSAGAACSSGTVAPSHALTAMGIPEKISRGTVRFSLGWTTSESDIERALERTVQVVRRMCTRT